MVKFSNNTFGGHNKSFKGLKREQDFNNNHYLHKMNEYKGD